MVVHGALRQRTRTAMSIYSSSSAQSDSDSDYGSEYDLTINHDRDDGNEENVDAIKVIPSFLDSFLEETSRSAGGVTGSSSDAIYHSQVYSNDDHHHRCDDDNGDDDDGTGILENMKEDFSNLSTGTNSRALSHQNDRPRRSVATAATAVSEVHNTAAGVYSHASYSTRGSNKSMYTSILHVSNRDSNSNNHNNHNSHYDNNEENLAHDEQMKAIEKYLHHHHEVLQSQSKSNSKAKEGSGTKILEDHRLYYYTNSASATAVKRTFLYCIQTDDIDLAERLLRDVGVEYLLRHCVLYNHGVLDEQINLNDGYSSNKNKNCSNSNSSISSRTNVGSKSRSNNNNNIEKRPGLIKTCSKAVSNRREGPANIFWLAALHGSARVLELTIEATWVHFAEMSFSFLNQISADGDSSNQAMNRTCDESAGSGINTTQTQDEKHDGDGNIGGVIENIEQMEGDCSLSIIDYKKLMVEGRAKKELAKILNESAPSYGTTPLYAAAAKNHRNVISLLLQYGADPNKPSTDNKAITTTTATPAIIAASRNNTEALEALAESSKTDFNQENVERKITPLLAACQSGCIESVRFLTQLTKTAYAVDEQCRKGDGDHDNECDVRVVNCRCQDSMGYGCAAIAAQYNQHEVIIYLCQIHDPDSGGIDINQRNIDGDSVIHVSVRYNRCSVVRALLEMIPRTCNIMALNNQGKTALHIAANRGFTQVVKEFVRCLPREIITKFDVEDVFGMTPIFYGCLNGYDDIVNILAPISDIDTQRRVQLVVKKKNETSTRTNDMSNDRQKKKKKKFTMQSPLHTAACHGFVNIVYTLLHCGADINQTDSEGHTALALASKMGHLEVVKILVEQGADMKMKSKRGKTPLAKARKYRRSHVIQYLDQHVAR